MNTSRREFLAKAWAAMVIVPILSQCTYDVLPPILEILTPNGGENFVPQTSSTIRWKAINVGLLLIELSIDNGKTWVKIAEDVPPEPEFWEWQVPKVNSTTCRIRISDRQSAELQDESDAAFSIQPILKLTYPNGGEVLNPQQKEKIRWEAAGTGDLLIELSSVESIFWIKIAEKVPSELGFYELNLPPRDSDKCLIRITDVTNPALQDQSDAFFTIRQMEVILLSEHPELQQPGGLKVFENVLGGFAVLAVSANVFKVLSLSCTHAGCGVEWQGAQFLCPCHGSAFDRTGCVLNGPAQVPLWTHEFNYDAAAGTITIYNRLTTGKC